MTRLLGAVSFLALALCVLASNAAIERWGVVPVGFGLRAPAAVYVVGLAFVARDLVHTYLGRVAAGVAILIGAALTLAVAPALAVASAVAYLVSETVDLLIFDRAAPSGWSRAVVASSAVGLTVDSVIFLGLAPGLGYDLLPGQLVGKAVAVALALALLTLAPVPRRLAAR